MSVQVQISSALLRTGRGNAPAHPTAVQLRWLKRGLEQPGGKLSLFDVDGQSISERTVQSCIRQGWAEPWFDNPLKPNWLVCKLTHLGRVIAQQI